MQYVGHTYTNDIICYLKFKFNSVLYFIWKPQSGLWRPGLLWVANSRIQQKRRAVSERVPWKQAEA